MKSKLSLSCVDIIQLVEQSGATNVAKASCPFTIMHVYKQIEPMHNMF